MAYEKELIAAMNNPVAVAGLRCAQLANDFLADNAKLQKKLDASHAENDALHKDLGEAYDCIRIRDEKFLDDVGKYAQEAALWKRRAYNLRTLFFALLGLWVLLAEALMLGWL